MKYILLTSAGKQFVFYVKDCAEIYKRIWGGEIHTVIVGTIYEN